MSSKVICILHGARPCNCLRDPVAARRALRHRRDRRRGDQRAARERVRATGERYSVALDAVRRAKDLPPPAHEAPLTLTKLGALLAALKAQGALMPTDSGGRIRFPTVRHPFRGDAWLRMNSRMTESTVRDVEQSVRYAIPFSRMASPTLTKHGLLFQFARLEHPLAAAQQHCNVLLVERIRRLTESIDGCLRILDRRAEEVARRYRGLFDRQRWGLAALEESKLPPDVEAAVQRVREMLAEVQDAPSES